MSTHLQALPASPGWSFFAALFACTVLVLTTTRAKHQSTVRIARGSHAIYLAGFPGQFLGKSHWLRFSFGMIAETFGFSTQLNFWSKADDRHCCSHKIPVLSKAWRHCCRDMVSMTLATTFAHIKMVSRPPGAPDFSCRHRSCTRLLNLAK